MEQHTLAHTDKLEWPDPETTDLNFALLELRALFGGRKKRKKTL